MAIAPICDKCKQELTKFGALLFSPPDADNKTHKYHLCVDCYQKLVSTFPKK